MEILKKPILSEKVAKLAANLNHIAFKVDHRANKLEIKNAIEKMYGVSIESINTMTVFPKMKSRNTKAGVVTGNAAKYKKAIVKLKGSETIDFYSTI